MLNQSINLALHKTGMENEPPRRQEHQELSFSMKRENKIIQLSVQRHKFKLTTGVCCRRSGMVISCLYSATPSDFSDYTPDR
ncbi:MAG: hypothetical protein N2235_16080 [Fischerella sp.]|nr:hypothetical protein [Fischerella sp.]